MVLHSSDFGMTSIEAEEVWGNVFVDNSCQMSSFVSCHVWSTISQGEEFVIFMGEEKSFSPVVGRSTVQ